MFLENCIATAQSDLRIKNKKDNVILIPDNEPRNKEIVKQIERFINDGYSVVLWPEYVKEKDINENDIDDRFPIQEVSTGGPFIIVPLKTLDALKRAKVDVEKCFDLMEKTEAKSILIFCPQVRNKGNDLSVRVFAHYQGIPEDPATGSGNGCLAAYLVKHQYFIKNSINIRVEQGHEVGRPSLLYLKAEETEGGDISVSVGGKVFLAATGELSNE